MYRRGVWPLVAAIILTLITVVAAILLYLWFSNYQYKAQSGAQSINLLPAAIITGATMYTNQSTTTVTAILENIGDANISIAQAIIMDQDGNTICSATPNNGLTEHSQANIITIKFTCNPLPNNQYETKIITNNGLTLQALTQNNIASTTSTQTQHGKSVHGHKH
ncbi:MAG: archaellin/type IV pilin N-terminal domain-containing protein [Thermocladium sp.]